MSAIEIAKQKAESVRKAKLIEKESERLSKEHNDKCLKDLRELMKNTVNDFVNTGKFDVNDKVEDQFTLYEKGNSTEPIAVLWVGWGSQMEHVTDYGNPISISKYRIAFEVYKYTPKRSRIDRLITDNVAEFESRFGEAMYEYLI